MSKNSKKKLKWLIPIAVLSATCLSTGLLASCKDDGEHTHVYEWRSDDDEHWKECPEDGVIDEDTRGPHDFTDGKCECGAIEVPKTYGSATGTITLKKLGGTETDFSDVIVDMGDDDVELSFNREEGKFTVEHVVVGKTYSLVVSKPGYQSYTVNVQLQEEGEIAPIGGKRGVVLEYKAFDCFMGFNTELHDMTHVNDAEPFISYKDGGKDKSFNVATTDSYEDVAVTLDVKRQNSVHGWHFQGLALRFDDGKHLAIHYQGGNHRFQIANNQWNDEPLGLKKADSLFGEDVGLNEWGEKGIYDIADNDAKLNSEEGVPLTAILKDGKLTVLVNEVCCFTYQLPEEYAEKKAKVLFYAYDAATNAIFSYRITENIPSLESALNINVTNPEDGTKCSVTTDKDTYELGETAELTFTAPADYKLDALTVNGVDMLDAVSGGKLTIAADRANVAVNATFVKKVPIALNVSIKGKKFGKTTNLAAGTEVRLSGYDTPFTVDASGKITDTVIKGRYTVKVAGYFDKKIVVDENLTEIVLEYDAFKVICYDESAHDLSHVNDEKPYIQQNGPGASMDVISKEKLYDDVSVSVLLKASTSTDGDRQQGVILQFEDGKVAALNINISGTPRLQFRPDLWGNDSKLVTAFKENWVEFRNVTPEEVAKYQSETGIKLTLERRGKYLYTFLDGVFKGRAELPADYEDDKAGIGFFAFDVVHGSKWYFEVSETLSDIDVSVTNNTEAGTGGTISVSTDTVLGDTVVITVTPESTHMLDSLTVSGGITPTRQADGTYTFVATEKSYTVTATFAVKVEVNVEVNVSGIEVKNTPVTFEDGTQITFTTKAGEPKNLAVTDGRIQGTLWSGEYTVSVNGYYDVKVMVKKDGTLEGVTDGLKFEKIIFTTNGINEPEGNIFTNGATVSWSADDSHAASAGKLVATKDGKMYEWTVNDYQDVAFTVTLKNGNGNQGIVMRFGGEQKDVRLRFENTKAQWIGGSWWWGTFPIHGNWDFRDNGGNDYAVPMSDALLAKYNGDGLTLTMLRRGPMVYALIDGKVYAAQNLGEGYASKKVKFCYFAEDSKNGYEVPFEIETNVNAFIDKTLDHNTMNAYGQWTVTDTTLAINGYGYIEIAPLSDATKESLSVTIASKNNPDKDKKQQGIIYRFADGNWFTVRIESSNAESYIQYAEDSMIINGASCLKTGWGKAGGRDLTDKEVEAFNGNGINLKLVRDGKYFYVVLGNTVLDVFSLNDKYAAMDGVMVAIMEQGNGTAYAYEYKSGTDVVIPEGYYTASVSCENAHGYDISIDKQVVKSGESVTLTIKTNASWWDAWSWFPTSVKVNGEEKFVATDMVSNGANHLTYTLVIENVTADAAIEVVIGKGTIIEHGVVVTVKDNVGGTAESDSGENGYYWNDGCDIYMKPAGGYEIESITVDGGTPVTSGWTFDSKNNRYVYTLPVSITKPTTVVVAYKLAETAPEVTATVSKVTDPTTAIVFGADITEDGKTYEVLAYERYGRDSSNTKATATVDANNLMDGANLINACQNVSGSFGGHGYAVSANDPVADGSCFYIHTGTVALKITKDVKQIRIYVGAWSGQTGTFALKTKDGKTLATTDYANDGENKNDVIIFDVNTAALEDGASVELVLDFVNTTAEGTLPCAGIQLLGEKPGVNNDVTA